HATQPAVVDEGHVDPARVTGDDLLGLLLRPDEQDDPATTAEPLHEGVRFLEPGQGLLEVDDVDPGTLPEEVPLHLRVPPSGLVAEVHARLEELPPGHDRHGACSCNSVVLRSDRSVTGPSSRRGTPAMRSPNV